MRLWLSRPKSLSLTRENGVKSQAARLDQHVKPAGNRRLRGIRSTALSTCSDRGEEVVAAEWFRKKADGAGVHC